MKSLSEYAAWFNSEHSKIALERGAQEIGPLLRPTNPAGTVPWQLIWAVLFSDGLHVKITENHCPTRCAGVGVRNHFAFHYGQTSASLDPRGLPIKAKGLTTILRVDCDRKGPHIHYGGQDHIPQARVRGLDIVNLGLFDFVDAVMVNRRTGRLLDEILNFTVNA